MTKKLKNSVRGAILGVAIGDSLGMPAEGKTPETIEELYGRITSYVNPKPLKDKSAPFHKLKKGQWTDDTQLTLAIGESILSKKCIDYADIAERHMRIYKDRRGWGGSTKKSVVRMVQGIPWWLSGEKYGAGNGPPMKISPIGVLHGLNIISSTELLNAVMNISRMTHLDNRAVLAAIFQARLISDCIKYKDLKKNIDNTLNYVSKLEVLFGLESKSSICLCIAAAIDMVINGKNLEEIRAAIGARSYVIESYPFTLAVLYKYENNLKLCIEELVNQGGDADTTASMGASIMGACYGYSEFPLKWRRGLEGKRRLIALADGLFSLKER